MVAVGSSQEILFLKEDHDPAHSNAAFVGGFCRSAFQFIEQNKYDLVAIVVTEGPGSYTGLRIGASIAKGLAFARKLPLIALPSMQIVASDFREREPEFAQESDVCVVMPSSKEDFYIQIFPEDRIEGLSPFAASFTSSLIDQIREERAPHRVVFLGEGVDSSVISEIDFNFVSVSISPLPMNRLAWTYYKQALFADLAYWQPQYVKPYEAKISKNKVLNR